jgi:AcrR family transcriptional regulator
VPKISAAAAAAKRDAILEAAERCFARQGFHQTTIQDVIAESGLSAGGIYGHFRSKEELIVAIAERRHAHDTDLLAGAATGADPLDTLRGIARAFLRDLSTPQGLQIRRVGLQLWAEAASNPPVRDQVVAGARAPARIFRDLLTAAAPDQTDFDPDAAARAMVALFQGFVLQRLWDDGFDEAQALAAFEALLDGYLRR